MKRFKSRGAEREAAIPPTSKTTEDRRGSSTTLITSLLERFGSWKDGEGRSLKEHKGEAGG